MPGTIVDRDIRIFDFIEGYITSHGYSPTVREIMAATSCCSKNIDISLRRLKRASYIDYQTKKSRTIVIVRFSVTEAGHKAVQNEEVGKC